MSGSPFNLQGKGVLEVLESGEEEEESFWVGINGQIPKKRKGLERFEPRSVLDSRRSPSPPTSSSTLSSSLGGHKWPLSPELHPFPSGLDMGGEDLEAVLSMPVAVSPTQEHTFLQWAMADSEDGANSASQGFEIMDSGFNFESIEAPSGLPIMGSSSCNVKDPSFGFFHQEPIEDKQLLFAPNQAFFVPAPQLNVAPPYHLQHRPMKPKTVVVVDELAVQQQQALVDQLFRAAELIEAGNPVSARGILARLNQQLPSPLGKPLLRSAFYFKEALHLIANNVNSPAPPQSHYRTPGTPIDVLLKLSTFNAFSEVSPVVQFTNFTCVQALLEELGASKRIHIIDFDIGVGGQWSSFMQELAQRAAVAGVTPLLKITAFASNCSHHPLELHLTHENLSHFASDLNITFEFNVLSLDPFDPSPLIGLCAGAEEAIAVNLPVGCGYHPPFSTLLRLVKQLSPKIVVSVDHGCDRGDLPFSHQFLHAFQSCTVLLDSIDAAGTDPDISNKIERLLLQPRIENALLGRLRVGDKMLPWRTLFASAGLVPMQFSNFTETQAECLLARVQVRGFHVEKRQGSLFLCWQHGELVSVSAWRC